MVQQAFDKVGGEGVIPTHFDPEIGDITIDFSTLLDEKKVCKYLNALGAIHSLCVSIQKYSFLLISSPPQNVP